jgi:hypothetical protein
MELNLTFVDLPAVRLLVTRAEGFPDGIAAAFERVECGLDSLRGRKLYGVCSAGPAGMEYHAGVEPEDDAEGERLGLPLMVIPAGAWARTTLVPWEEHKDEIGPLVDGMIESVDYDSSRPTLAFYRSGIELQLLVPVGGVF